MQERAALAVALLWAFAGLVGASEDHGLIVFWAADGIHEIFMNSTGDDPTKTGQRLILKWPRGDDVKNLWPPVIGGLCADAAHGIVAWTENRHVGGKNRRGVFMAELDGSSTEPTLLADLGEAEGDLSQGCAIDPEHLTIYFCEFIKKIHKQRITEIHFKGHHGAWEPDGNIIVGRTMAVQETHPQGGGVVYANGFPYMTASKVTAANPKGVPGMFKETADGYDDVQSTTFFGGWRGHLGFPVVQSDGTFLMSDSDDSKKPSADRKGVLYKLPKDLTSELFTPYRGSLPISPHVGDDSTPGETNSIALQPTMSVTSVPDDVLFLQGEPPQAIYEAAFSGPTKRFEYRVIFAVTHEEEIGEYGIGPIVWCEDLVHTPAPPTPVPPPMVLCEVYTCSTGYTNKADKGTLPCGTAASDCSDETCCDKIVVTCAGFMCPDTHTDIMGKDTVNCAATVCATRECCVSKDTPAPDDTTPAPGNVTTPKPGAAPDETPEPVATTPTPAAVEKTPEPGAAGGTPTPGQAGASTPQPGLGAAPAPDDDGLSHGVVVLLCVLVGVVCLLCGAVTAWMYVSGKNKKKKLAAESNVLFSDERSDLTLGSTHGRSSALVAGATLPFSPVSTDRSPTGGSPTERSPVGGSPSAEPHAFAPIDRMYSTRTADDPRQASEINLNMTSLRAPAGDVRLASNIEIVEMHPLGSESTPAGVTSSRHSHHSHGTHGPGHHHPHAHPMRPDSRSGSPRHSSTRRNSSPYMPFNADGGSLSSPHSPQSEAGTRGSARGRRRVHQLSVHDSNRGSTQSQSVALPSPYTRLY